MWSLVRQMGPGWVAFRAGYALRRRGGWLRHRSPVRDWPTYSFATLTRGRSPEDVLGQLRGSALLPNLAGDERCRALGRVVRRDGVTAVVQEVEQALKGEVRFFSGAVRTVGWPPDWHRHPDDGVEWPRVHWTAIDDRVESDVKWLWELGRFGLAYAILRAYSLTGESRYPEVFWRLVESWREANPPNIGVHWMCGQECAFRTIAWTFALLALLDTEATTPARAGMLIEMLAAHGDRIDANLAYARSQKNNHAINEALALWTLGTVFPMLGSSARWERIGRAVLEKEARRQIYDDGAYVQHSLGYHRLILESYAWAIELGQRSGRPFSLALVTRCQRAAAFLYQLVDDTSGRMPNYGSNDGSRLFSLDACDPADVRPSLALAFWATERRRVLGDGPWDEPLLWICGDQALAAKPSPVARVDLAAADGGYYILRSADTWGFLRCCTYRDRPAHADMLHLDLWWRGHNIVADPGTYSYNSRPPWNNGLSSTRVHNTVTVDGLDQMERGARFLWFDWNRGRVVRRSAQPAAKLIETEHDGYARRAGVQHRRAVLLVGGRVWIVVDDLIGSGLHSAGSHWVFPGGSLGRRGTGSYRIDHAAGIMTVSFAAFPNGDPDEALCVEEVTASDDVTIGWLSDTYLHRRPVPSLVVSQRALLPLRLVTLIALGGNVTLDTIDRNGLSVSFDGRRITATWCSMPYAASASLVRSVTESR